MFGMSESTFTEDRAEARFMTSVAAGLGRDLTASEWEVADACRGDGLDVEETIGELLS